MAYCASNFLSADPYAAFATALAVKKCHLPLAVAFTKGIAANWLVNMAVYMAVCSKYVQQIRVKWEELHVVLAMAMDGNAKCVYDNL